MTLSSVSIDLFPPTAAPTKNPIAQAPWGLARETRYTK
jgi:hypothetical protein